MVLAGVSLAAAWSGLSGTWVGDDWHMVGNYLYADWAELGAVFQRNAAYYLFADERIGAGPYRPITMLTLLGTHLLGPEPWLHHALSWLLHALTAVLLFLVLRHQLAERGASTWAVDVTGIVLTACFALHPVQVESYVWINGRSDLLAGLWLVVLLLLLELPSTDRVRRLRPVMLALVAFLGVGSKLPFAFAAGAGWAAWAMRGRPSWRLQAGLAIVGALGLHVVLRATFAPFDGSVGSSTGIVRDQAVWLAIPKLWADAVWALVSLRAEAMQSLSWALYRPWSFSSILGLVLAVLAVGALIWRRDRSGLAYVIGGMLTLAPVVLVSRSFWMGFDRYLYMPSVLFVLAAGPYVLKLVVAASTTRRARAFAVAGAALLVALALQTKRASATYSSQAAHDAALVEDHPLDPTVHYYLARAAGRSGDLALLDARLAQMPGPPWPRAIAVPTYELAARIGNDEKTRQAISALVETTGPEHCTETRERLLRWRERAPDPEITSLLTRSADGIACDRR